LETAALQRVDAHGGNRPGLAPELERPGRERARLRPQLGRREVLELEHDDVRAGGRGGPVGGLVSAGNEEPRAARHAQPRACSRTSASRWSRFSSGLPSRRADWSRVYSCAVRAQRRLISAAVPTAGGTFGALVPVGGVARIFTAPPLQLGGIGLSE